VNFAIKKKETVEHNRKQLRHFYRIAAAILEKSIE